MQMMGRIGFMGLGIALASCLTGGPVFAEDKPAKPPIEDGSKVMITSPKDGDEVDDTFELYSALTFSSHSSPFLASVYAHYQFFFSVPLFVLI